MLRASQLTAAAALLTFRTRAEQAAGAWEDAVVSTERAVAVAEEAEHQLLAFVGWPVVAIAAARGDWERAERGLRY
jgi:hypothetical protein